MKAMDTAFSDTIDKMNEKLSEQTEKFEHLNSVLDHYNNLLGLFNKQNNYKAVGTILES
jgi:pantothenate kinase type III